MRKSNQEITDPRIIETILSKSEICRIAIWDQEVPYILPLNYGYRNGIIYIHSSSQGKKIDLLKKNNRVAFEITRTARTIKAEKPCRWSTNYQSVTGAGKIEILNEEKDKIQGLEILMEHYGAVPPHHFDRNEVAALVILKLTIDTLTGKQSGNFNPDLIK